MCVGVGGRDGGGGCAHDEVHCDTEIMDAFCRSLDRFVGVAPVGCPCADDAVA